MTISYLTIDSPIGQILISISNSHVDKIELFTPTPAVRNRDNSEINSQLITQFTRYFQQAHNKWSFPLDETGTPFQRRVWLHLQSIPIGKTQTYSNVAAVLNTSPRAVANACRANPFAIVVPCHRVVAKTGLGGYYGKTSGEELRVKQWLLNHERG